MRRSFMWICLLLFPGLLAGQEAKIQRPAINGISHMTLYADDLAKSQQFYGSLLGWEQAPAGTAQSGVRFYANHLQYIELVSPPSKGLANRLVGIGFSTSDAEALRTFLAVNGVPVPQAVTVEQDGSRSFEVQDPEGNKIEFNQSGMHPPKEDRSASRRVSTHIIHAGFVVRNRAAMDHFYKDVLGFHLYWQGGQNPGIRTGS